MKPQSSFYWSPSDIIPSACVSSMVAALLIANATLGTPELYAADYAPIFPEFSEVSNGAFYHETSEVDALPGEALQIFSKKLLEQTVDTPPEITAIISKHFWELL